MFGWCSTDSMKICESVTLPFIVGSKVHFNRTLPTRWIPKIALHAMDLAFFHCRICHVFSSSAAGHGGIDLTFGHIECGLLWAFGRASFCFSRVVAISVGTDQSWEQQQFHNSSGCWIFDLACAFFFCCIFVSLVHPRSRCTPWDRNSNTGNTSYIDFAGKGDAKLCTADVLTVETVPNLLSRS